MAQYRTDRDPTNADSRAGALVHFAVDPERVAMTTRLAGAGRASCRSTAATAGGARATRPTRTGTDGLPVGAGLGARRLARPPGRFVHVEQPAKGYEGAARAVIFPRYHQWDAVLRLEAARPGRRRRAALPGPALGRARASRTRSPGWPTGCRRCTTRRRQGLRQGHRDHRPGGPRPPAPGDDLPVRARARRRREDRQGLRAARGGAGRRAGADHHHDAAEVPVRPRQGR